MLVTLLEALLAPALVGASGVAARRWDTRVGGLVSAFPAIVGPVLLIAADRHGAAYAADVATGTLLGLAALAGFALTYGYASRRAPWLVALATGWAAAAALTAVSATLSPELPVALGAAVVSLGGAYAALSRLGGTGPERPLELADVRVRMALTFALVVALAAAAGRFGPLVGGLLAALPVLASLLAATTHAQQGRAAVLELLRGMLAGMGGFVVFCLAVAALAEPAGVTVTFGLALAGALTAQALAARLAPR